MRPWRPAASRRQRATSVAKRAAACDRRHEGRGRPHTLAHATALQALFSPATVAVNRVMTEQPYHIRIEVETRYIPEQSTPTQNRYVFAYTITIYNAGTVAAQLLSRHWIITDANGRVQEVRGEGVVGEQPHLKPGEGFRYTSGAVIETPVGTMHGSYQMKADDATRFDAPIPAFRLSVPGSLH